MRNVAWNLGHQTREQAIKPRLVEAVAAIAPDVLTLNEYVHGPFRTHPLSDLTGLGLEHVEVSSRDGRLNQVLVVSRHRLVTGDLARLGDRGRPLLHRQISVENIQKTVADFYKIKVADMYSARPRCVGRR